MTQRNFDYSEYDPSDHRADCRAVISGLVVMLVFFVGIVVVH